MLYVYIGSLTFGVAYAILSALLGGHGFDHGGFDHGGFDHTGADGSSGNQADVPSPFNPLVIASAIAAFGAVGLISRLGFGMSDLLSSIVSLLFAGLIGAAVFFGVVKLVYSSQSDSTFSLQQLEGVEAEVITPIPAKGVGEVAYIFNGTRCSIAAKPASQTEIKRGEKVRIREIIGSIAVVSKVVTIDQLECEENEVNRLEKDNN